MLVFRGFQLQIVKRAPRPFDGDDWLFEIKHDEFEPALFDFLEAVGGRRMVERYKALPDTRRDLQLVHRDTGIVVTGADISFFGSGLRVTR